MRIWMLTHRLPYAPNRGDRLRAYHILRYLSQRAEVHVLSLVHDDDELAAADELRPHVASVHPFLVPRLGNLVRGSMRLATRDPLTLSLLNAPELRRAIPRLLDSHRPDVMLAYCSSMAQYAMLPEVLDIPFVLDLVDVDSEKWKALSQTSSWPMNMVYKREASTLSRFEREAVKAAETAVVVNEKEAMAIRAIEPDATVTTVQNGVALEHFAPVDATRDENTVVFCGVLNYTPNEDAAIRLGREIWPLVRREIPDANLVLVGSSPTPRVRALESTAERITVTGAVPDVRPYLWNASVSVAPLTVARGVQNKVLEALAAGLPVVVSPVVAEGVPQSAHPGLTVANTNEEFASSIVSLLKTSSEDRASRASSADLTPLSWDRQIEPLWAALVSASRAPQRTDRSRAAVAPALTA